MKVVQINAVYNNSSTGRNTKELHNYLISLGYSSYVFCSNVQDKENNVFVIGNWFDHKLHALESLICGLQGYFSFCSTYKMLQHLEYIKPDVVLLHNLHANFINVPLLLNYLAKKEIPTIFVLHDCWFFTGHCCHYTEDGCFKWKIECMKCPIPHKYNRSLFFDRSRKVFIDRKRYYHSIPKIGVIGVSDWITNEARLSPLFPSRTLIRRIYNWIDLDVFYPRETKKLREELSLSGCFVALGVAQVWTEAKGLMSYIQVANLFPQIKIILIGKMPINIDLPKNIISVGQITNIELLATYYSLADVFLNFSKQETFGKVMAEAMACGTPLIVNNQTAIPELVGDCGFIVHQNNIKEITIALNEIIRTGKNNYMKKCSSRVKLLFEKKNNLNDYIKFMQNLISL